MQKNGWAWAPLAVGLLLMIGIGATHANQVLFLHINAFGHLVNSAFWANMTMLGDGAVALALVLPCVRQSPERFWAAVFAAILAALWVQLWKHLAPSPRPLAVLPAAMFYHYGPPLRNGSFPSGHTAAAFALAGIWILSLKRLYVWRALLLLLAITVGLSRIMVGMHWPLDLLSGMLGGWLAAMAGLALARRWRLGTVNVGGYLCSAVLAAVAVALLFSHHVGFAAAMPLQQTIGAVCLVWGGRELLLMSPYRFRRTSPAREAMKHER